jgi:hypothetical protein
MKVLVLVPEKGRWLLPLATGHGRYITTTLERARVSVG